MPSRHVGRTEGRLHPAGPSVRQIKPLRGSPAGGQQIAGLYFQKKSKTLFGQHPQRAAVSGTATNSAAYLQQGLACAVRCKWLGDDRVEDQLHSITLCTPVTSTVLQERPFSGTAVYPEYPRVDCTIPAIPAKSMKTNTGNHVEDQCVSW